MPVEGQAITNARTGQRMTFLEISPQRLRIDTVNPPTGDRPEPLHSHPKQESGAEVTAGSLVFDVAGQERRVEAGESIRIPAGTRHRFWNGSGEDAVAVQWFEPALDTAAFFETFFALARDGELDEKGMPGMLQLAVLVPEFGDEIRPASPPWPVLRALTAVLGPVARLRGYEARRD